MPYYSYNGQHYILQDRLYYKVAEGSVIVDKTGQTRVEPIPESVLSESESVLPVLLVLPVTPEQEPLLPEPESSVPESKPIITQKKR